ncbi:MAG: ASCH domain-containing protein [Nitrososphaeraceae archaeon]
MIAFYPIKPIYSEKILTGKKTYELRKRLPNSDVDYILIYSTCPIAKVVAYAKVKKMYKAHVNDIWEMVSFSAGIDKAGYMDYFGSNDFACAIEFEYVRQFKRPFDVKEINPDFKVPQSFCYIDKEDFRRLKRRKTENV